MTDMLNLNFAGMESDFETVPAGTYKAVLKAAEKGLSKANQPKVDLKFILTQEGFVGTPVTTSLSLQEKALFKLRQFLIAMGVEREKLGGQYNVSLRAFLGRPIGLKLSQREYNGNIYMQVDQFIRADQATGPDPEAEELKSAPAGADLSEEPF
jgi:hypothetical protein